MKTSYDLENDKPKDGNFEVVENAETSVISYLEDDNDYLEDKNDLKNDNIYRYVLENENEHQVV